MRAFHFEHQVADHGLWLASLVSQSPSPFAAQLAEVEVAWTSALVR